MYDDIPEAVRQSVKEPSRINIPLVGLIAGGGLLGLLVIALLRLQPQSQPIAPSSSASSVAPSPTAVQSAASPTVSSSPTADADNIFGHLTYPEAPANELEAITPDGQTLMRQISAESYQKMAAAAALDGVNLFPISGFRSVADQNELFFQVSKERNQAVSKRGEVSAPPGRSEHHTGYAIDLGDASQPDTNLSQSFEETSAFRWLSEHAAQYSFEMSFPRDNPQGVSYEPWHWRFVGDRNSLETFYRAQHLKSNTP
jgi:zinc D-Ala-D-Ala carboxypeptidase